MATPPTSARQAGRQVWRVLRLPLALAVLLLSGAIVVTAFGEDDGRYLGAHSYAPYGANAIRVLTEDRGVEVDVVDDTGPGLERAEQGEVTLLVPADYRLAPRTMERIVALPPTVRVVFVDPEPFTLSRLDPGVLRGGTITEGSVVAPRCDWPEAVAAGEVTMDGVTYRSPDAAERCYGGQLLVFEPSNGPEVVVLGDPTPMTNDALDEHGNAALALGVLTAHPTLVWLELDGPEPLGPNEEPPGSLFPPWVGTAALHLLLAGVLAALWQGRRLGAPVAEPLPVIVRSAETVEGRARLYRRSGAHDLAAAALRSGALGRLAPALGLGSEPDPRATAKTVADRTDRTTHEVHRLLHGPPPRDDAGLVTLARDLDRLVVDVLDPATGLRPTTSPTPEGPRP